MAPPWLPQLGVCYPEHMPKRIPAIPDELLIREVGHLSDEVLLLPRQVQVLTGLSVSQLKERLRTRPPKPPHPEPRERPRDALWYSLGEIRRYRGLRAEQAEVNAELAKRGFGFAAWLAGYPTDPWPFALVGPHKRPVDIWATIRGEAPMARTDAVAWLTLDDYLRERLRASLGETAAADRATRVAVASERQGKGLKARSRLPARRGSRKRP